MLCTFLFLDPRPYAATLTLSYGSTSVDKKGSLVDFLFAISTNPYWLRESRAMTAWGSFFLSTAVEKSSKLGAVLSLGHKTRCTLNWVEGSHRGLDGWEIREIRQFRPGSYGR